MLFFVDEKLKKKSCWGCKSSDVIKWGKQNNKQRFKCKKCGLLFTRQNKKVKVKCKYVMLAKEVGNETNIKPITGTFHFKVRTSRK